MAFSWHLTRQDSYYVTHIYDACIHLSICPLVIYLLVAMYKWIWHPPGRPENARTLPRIMITFGLVCKDTLVELWKMCRHYVSKHSWRGQCLLATEGLRKKGRHNTLSVMEPSAEMNSLFTMSSMGIQSFSLIADEQETMCASVAFDAWPSAVTICCPSVLASHGRGFHVGGKVLVKHTSMVWCISWFMLYFSVAFMI